MKATETLRRIGTPLLVVIAVCGLAAVAGAHKKTYPTTVTAQAQNKNQIEGKVLSTKTKCVPGRIVALYSPAGALEGTDSTDSLGNYRIAAKDLAPGTHTVKVNKRVITKTKRHKHKCAPAEATLVIPATP
jgi:hypothetical protein